MSISMSAPRRRRQAWSFGEKLVVTGRRFAPTDMPAPLHPVGSRSTITSPSSQVLCSIPYASYSACQPFPAPGTGHRKGLGALGTTGFARR